MVYVTGDVHGYFGRIERFCAAQATSAGDVLVLLGDTCINHWGDRRDEELKRRLAALPVTFLCVHGNHELRPCEALGYREEMWAGSTVFVQDAYPNLLFAKDGSVFDLGGLSCLVAGGAYSIDKDFRISDGRRWFADEQPGPVERANVERACDAAGWKVDFVFSHTCPIEKRPRQAFLARVRQSEVDTSTEEWLTGLEERLEFRRWMHGHFHMDLRDDSKVWTLFKDVIELKTGRVVFNAAADAAMLADGWPLTRRIGRSCR